MSKQNPTKGTNVPMILVYCPTTGTPPKAMWANPCGVKDKSTTQDWRCVKCGQKGHGAVKTPDGRIVDRSTLESMAPAWRANIGGMAG